MGCGGSKPATTGAAGGGTAAGAASKSAAKGGEKKKSFDADYKRGSTVSLCHADVSYLWFCSLRGLYYNIWEDRWLYFVHIATSH
jgi:hypothetical protein